MKPLSHMRAIRDADADLSHTALAVAWALALHASVDTSTCSPSAATLAADTRLSVRAVKYALVELVESGWLFRVQRYAGRRQTSNAYRLTTPGAVDNHGPGAVDNGPGAVDNHGPGAVDTVDNHDGGVHHMHGGGAPHAPSGGAPGAHKGFKVMKGVRQRADAVDNPTLTDAVDNPTLTAVIGSLARSSRISCTIR